MEENKKYPLYNRDGNNIYVEHYGDNKYELKGDLKYIRVGWVDEEMTEIDFIDPSGGPFIKVGCFELEGKILKSITGDNDKILLNF